MAHSAVQKIPVQFGCAICLTQVVGWQHCAGTQSESSKHSGKGWVDFVHPEIIIVDRIINNIIYLIFFFLLS